MKQFTKIALVLMLAFIAPATATADTFTQQQIAAQIIMLKKMLNDCNNQYLYNATPMYQQSLTTHWWISFFLPCKSLQNGSFYNTELLSTEAKNLSDVIVAMEKLKNIENNDVTAKYLLDNLLRNNEAYLKNTPMHEQSLTLHWSLTAFLIPFLKNTQGNHFYNSEALLAESKKLADITYNMSQFQQN